MPDREYSTEERAILQALVEAHAAGWEMVSPTELATRTGLRRQQVEDWLEQLASTGAVRGTAPTFDPLERGWQIMALGRLVSEGALGTEQTTAGHTINVHGHQSRVNINSVDASTNVIKQGADEQLFADLRATLDEIEDETMRAELHRQAGEMEISVGTPDFSEKFKGFTEAAQPVMAMIGPYIPRLIELVGRSLPS